MNGRIDSDPARRIPGLSCLVTLAFVSAAGLSGCPRAKGSGTQPELESRDASLPVAPQQPPRRSTFLVQGAASTLFLPVDPQRAPVGVPGIWTATDAALHGRVELALHLNAATSPDTVQVPLCPDAELHAPCAWNPRTAGALVLSLVVDRHGAGMTRVFSDLDGRTCECVVLDGISTDPPRLDAEEQRHADELGLDAVEYVRLCEGDEPAELEASAILGGVLYRNGMQHEGTCEGLNIYTGTSDTVELRPDARAPRGHPSPARTCKMAFAELDMQAIDGAADDSIDGEDLDQCGALDEMEAWTLRRGILYLVEGEIQSAGGGCSCARGMPADAQTCPATSDPCGDEDLFDPAMLGDGDFWVASDDNYALAIKGGVASVLVPARETIRSAAMSAPVLGVEYHPSLDLVELATTMRGTEGAVPQHASILLGDAAQEQLEGHGSLSARQRGERCFSKIRADELDAAFAECIAGLIAGGSDGTRGALTFNLATIASRHGDLAAAHQWLTRSLRLRPGNAAALERLRAVEAALVEPRLSASPSGSPARP